jgi:nucleoside-diphosphate-sugar epimerase
MHTVAIRPSAVYGVEPANLPRSHGYKLVKKLIDRQRVTPADQPGGGKFVHVEDVAIATANAVEREAAAGRAFNMADTYAKFTCFAEHARDLLGLPEDTVEPDTGPPARNTFDKSACRDTLSVALDRGDAGLRAHTAELIEAIKSE